MKNKSLKKTLIFYTYLFITPILFIISLLLFLVNYYTAIDEETERQIKLTDNLLESAESIKTNLATYGTYITINSDITDILKSKDAKTLNKNAILWYDEAPMQVIEDMMALETSFETIALYPENGVDPYLRCFDSSSNLSKSVIRLTSEYKSAVEAMGKYELIRVEPEDHNFYESSRNTKLVLYREIYDLSRSTPLGYLFIGMSIDSLDELTENNISSATETSAIYTSKGNLLSIAGDEDALSELITINSLDITKLGSVSKVGGYFLFASSSSSLVTLKLVPKSEFYGSLLSVVWGPVLLLVGVLFGLLPVLTIISNRIFKPMNTLSEGMEEFKKGNLDLKIPVSSDDEIGALTNNFNEMVSGMKDLIEKNYLLTLNEKESELAALSAQINPHFLYNTLDTLYWRVIDAGDEDIAEDILALSDLFRLVLNKKGNITTVKTECELLDRYLHIQKMRFGKNLNYEINIEDKLESEAIPRLILQPFVENAVVHGFETGQGDFSLTINATSENNKLKFEIKDTGIGMSKETLANLFSSEDTREYRAERVGRYAIKNIKERLDMLYPNAFTLNIQSEENKGTLVTLIIPKKGGIYENPDC